MELTAMKTGNKRGFTLIEILVSVGIIGFLVVVLLQIFVTTVRTNAKTAALKDVKQNGDYVSDILTRALQNAQSITSPSGPYPASASSITITDKNGTSVTYYSVLQNGVNKIAQNNGSVSYLTSDTVTLNPSTVTFTVYAPAGVPAQVRYRFTLTKNAPAGSANYENASIQYDSTVDLRNIGS